MICLRSAFQIVSLAAIFNAGSALASFESVYELPRGWKHVGPADGAEAIRLRISLQQQNVEKFYDTLMDVSTPDHPKYGQHLQGEQIVELLKPRKETTDIVISWLQDHNITAIVDESDWIFFKTDVKTANDLLETKFQWYLDEISNKQVLRTMEYSVPKEVESHINFVQPTTRFGSLKALKSTVQEIPGAAIASTLSTATTASGIDVSCNSTITPKCLREIYNIHYKADPNNGNKAGYASFLEESARYADLALFEQKYAPEAIGENFTVVTFNGATNDQTSTLDSGEANLDNQYILSVGYKTPITEFITAGRGLLIPDGDSPTPADNTNEPYLDFLLALMKLPNSKIPQTISISYGENEQEIPPSYALQVCQLFGQLGARGTTVLFSTGDSGVGDFCQSNDGKNTTKFQPQFPASCPYVTSVGGTRYVEPEQATYFSSGGFSNLWPRPLYQELAVAGYLKQIGNKNKGLYNPKGRGTPDVAAQSYNFRVFNMGVDSGYQGTSCAAPTFGGVVALLNSARVSSKLPPFGFLNPWLYTVGQFGLMDVVRGASTGCNGLGRFNGAPNGSPVVPGASWNATKGWDPATGLGTPDFGKLLKISTPFVANKGGPLP